MLIKANVCHAFSGDANFKPYVCAEADVRSIPIGTDDEFLIMASDGLLDFVTPQEAAHAVFQQLREDNHGEYPIIFSI